MPIGTKRKAQLVALREENKKQKQASASQFPMALALPLPTTQATTTVAVTADAIAAAQAQELAVEVLTTFALLEKERASIPVDFDISAMVAQYNLDQGLRSGSSHP